MKIWQHELLGNDFQNLPIICKISTSYWQLLLCTVTMLWLTWKVTKHHKIFSEFFFIRASSFGEARSHLTCSASGFLLWSQSFIHKKVVWQRLFICIYVVFTAKNCYKISYSSMRVQKLKYNKYVLDKVWQ